MKISARNQFQGQIAAVSAGAVNSEVTVQLPSGQEIVSVVTNQSANALNLKPGTQAVALVKASSVLVMGDAPGLRLSARNCLAGTLTSLTKGPVHAEAIITLPGGEEVCASITHAAADALGLTEGMPASAVFKAPSVILAVQE